MGCTTCANNDGRGTPNGCKNNGTCSSGGCNKLEVFDWLADMELPVGKGQFDIVEIRFKNGRKNFYTTNNLSIHTGDTVVVEGSPGYDVGTVTLTGELVKIQMNRKKVDIKNHELRKVYRKASQEDLDKWAGARSREYESMHEARKMAIDLNLEMKISDVEYQGDGSKATFYYTADGRVDFRQLIKVMAEKFRVRIEMRQIGARQEAGRLGGIGSCGRELCCATWLTDFRSVSTSSARYQQLSLNPQKLAGQCGKLKCCLNYELDMYLEAYKDFPRATVKLKTQKGEAVHQKTDIFKRQMWYWLTEEKGGGKMVQLHVDRVKEIIALNKNGKKPADLNNFIRTEVTTEEEPSYENVVGQDELTRFDDRFKKSGKRKKSRSKKKSSLPKNQQGKSGSQKKGKPGSGRKQNAGRNKNNNDQNKNKK